ncbi:hypothetical protein GCM10028858_12740 [Halorubrum pallidum]
MNEERPEDAQFLRAGVRFEGPLERRRRRRERYHHLPTGRLADRPGTIPYAQRSVDAAVIARRAPPPRTAGGAIAFRGPIEPTVRVAKYIIRETHRRKLNNGELLDGRRT